MDFAHNQRAFGRAGDSRISASLLPVHIKVLCVHQCLHGPQNAVVSRRTTRGALPTLAWRQGTFASQTLSVRPAECSSIVQICLTRFGNRPGTPFFIWAQQTVAFERMRYTPGRGHVRLNAAIQRRRLSRRLCQGSVMLTVSTSNLRTACPNGWFFLVIQGHSRTVCHTSGDTLRHGKYTRQTALTPAT